MQQQIKELSELLAQKKWMLAVAESCTGGLLSAALTHRAGSSKFFDRGFVTYSNESKIEILDVPERTLNEFGAVSSQTAEAMVNGIFNHSKANIAVSITGIAGPDGGSEEKPVGLVYFGLGLRDGSAASFKMIFDGSRGSVREQATIAALDHLIAILKND